MVVSIFHLSILFVNVRHLEILIEFHQQECICTPSRDYGRRAWWWRDFHGQLFRELYWRVGQGNLELNNDLQISRQVSSTVGTWFFDDGTMVFFQHFGFLRTGKKEYRVKYSYFEFIECWYFYISKIDCVFLLLERRLDQVKSFGQWSKICKNNFEFPNKFHLILNSNSLSLSLFLFLFFVLFSRIMSADLEWAIEYFWNNNEWNEQPFNLTDK